MHTPFLYGYPKMSFIVIPSLSIFSNELTAQYNQIISADTLLCHSS